MTTHPPDNIVAWFDRHEWMSEDQLSAFMDWRLVRHWRQRNQQQLAYLRTVKRCAQEQIESQTIDFPFNPLRYVA